VVKIDGRAVHSILTGEKMFIDDYGFIFSKGNVASPGKECLIVPTLA
jgi:S-adenosylmethionine synthetase